MNMHPRHSFFREPTFEARAVQIVESGVHLHGDLVVPPFARGLVIFAHGSGSGRHSPRNRTVARHLNVRGLATLLLDLLQAHEEGDRRKVFDISLLAGRLAAATGWAAEEPSVRDLPLCLFGASTGAAVALLEAARPGERIAAVVSRGGRPDLAMTLLPQVTVPVLLIVGSLDEEVLALNEAALARLGGKRQLDVIPGASHLFEEPGALEWVAQLAGDWFLRYLPASGETPLHKEAS